MSVQKLWLVVGLVMASASICRAATSSPYFAIQVVDAQTGRGIPRVELRTVNEVRYYTDSNGIAAIDEPGLLGKEAYFFVSSDGYEYPKDGFGYRGVRLTVKAGETAVVKLQRVNIAERLYRVTGADIYRDSVLTGHSTPLEHPLLNGNVFGSDTVESTVYHGRMFWVWGDTNQPSYPLGNFNSTAATSALPGSGGLDPSVGVNLDYFTDPKTGFVKGIAPVPGSGPTWVDGLVTLQQNGKEYLFARYAKVRQDMSEHARGLLRFDDTAGVFRVFAPFDMKAPLYPRGHAFHFEDHGQDYIYFATPYPLFRAPATVDALRDPSQYEAFTCLKQGTHLDGGHLDGVRLDRDAAGRLRYTWKKDTSPVGTFEQEKLERAGLMKPGEGLLQLQDPDTGKGILAHAGTVYWNAYRHCWILITVQSGGTSFLGEVWYAEAPTPLGPWIYARKIVTHDRYSFYNPAQHPEFDQQGGKLIYFEGTYASTFAGSPVPTPRYDYNQMMYRLDLSDPRLALPALVSHMPWPASGPAADPGFCAVDRPAPGLAAVYWSQAGNQPGVLSTGKPETAGEQPIFYALPAETKNPPPTTAPLHEFVRKVDGVRTYSISDSVAGFERTVAPVCRVWKDPCRVVLP